jgi:hypothetical protein
MSIACRPVVLSEVRDSSALVWEKFRGIATEVANSQATKDLLQISNKQSEEYKTSLGRVKRHMRDITQLAWDADPHFAQAYESRLGVA